MQKSQPFLGTDLSPQRKVFIKLKKPIQKVNSTLQKTIVQKHGFSDLSTPRYSNPAITYKQPATTTAKKIKQVPKILFTKLNTKAKNDSDHQLSSFRGKKHKHTTSENVVNLHKSIKTSEEKTSIERKNSNKPISPRKIIENIASTESLLKSVTPRRSAENERTQIWQTMKMPTTPATVLKLFFNRMNNFEQAEILNYHEIYFIGNGKNIVKDQLSKNYGYDDDRGDYKIVLGDHIAYRYEMISFLGRGSFGQVVKAIDHKTRKEVALKVIRNKSKFHEQAIVEIEILKYLRDKDPENTHCVIHLLDYFAFRKHMVIDI